MLPDNDDLLNQLSCELGLSDFMDDGSSILADGRTGANLYDQFLSSSENEDHALFNELIYTDAGLPSSPGSFSIKSEPFSPRSTAVGSLSSGANSFPPSPSGSESSTDNNSMTLTTNQFFGPMDTSEVVTMCHIDETTPPVSPIAIDIPNIINIGPLTGIQCITLDRGGVKGQQQQQQQQINTSVSSVVNMSNLNKAKIPIPKITKAAPAPAIKTTTPFVLTPQQLAQLTQSGIIKVSGPTSLSATRVLASHPLPTPQPIVIKSEPAVGPSSPLSAGLPTVQTITPQPATYSVQTMISSHHNGGDMKTIKRQQRMIKNRESACLSRKKKKEYVTSLEDQLNQLSRENNQLKQENEQLKVRLRELESEKTLWTGIVLNNSTARKGTALFALLLVVSLNLGSFSGIYPDHIPLHKPVDLSAPSLDRVSRETRNIGRTLLWKTLTEPETRDRLLPPPNVSMCPLSVNQSESIRLDNQLRGWFRLDPEIIANVTNIEDSNEIPPNDNNRKKIRTDSKSLKTSNVGNTALDHYSKPAVQSLTGSIYHMLISERDIRSSKFGKYGETKRTPDGELTLYDTATPRFTFESFFEAIHRREDTFYVVSFSGDHLLLPAASRNQSARPRMSLILPSILLPVNESMQALPNHVLMMQIDCEVINTGLVHIKEDAIPIHLSSRMRSESGPASPSSAAASNSSLQRNDSKKPYEDQFRGYQNDISGPSERHEVDRKPEAVIRVNVENEIESNYRTEHFGKRDLRLINRKFRHQFISGTNSERLAKLSPGRRRNVNH